MLATSTPRENTNLTSVFSSESLGWKKKKKKHSYKADQTDYCSFIYSE